VAGFAEQPPTALIKVVSPVVRIQPPGTDTVDRRKRTIGRGDEVAQLAEHRREPAVEADGEHAAGTRSRG
jgi:hypothetical protein